MQRLRNRSASQVRYSWRMPWQIEALLSNEEDSDAKEGKCKTVAAAEEQLSSQVPNLYESKSLKECEQIAGN